MPRLNNFLPTSDGGKADLLEHLGERLPFYAELLGVSAAAIIVLKMDAVMFRYLNLMSAKAQFASHSWTGHKNLMRDGGAGSGALPPLLLSDLPPPAQVLPGIIPRLAALVAFIKASPHYTETIGKDLGIVGSERIIDPSSWQPVLNLKLDAGQVMVGWTKGDAEALEVWVARGAQSEFVMLDSTTDPHFTDPAPFPAIPTLWRYKAIYRLHDEHVGSWSSVATTAVGG